MIYWFWGYPGIGKDYIAKIFSETTGVFYIDGDSFLNKTEKRKLILGTFTKTDRIKKLQRIATYLKKVKKDITITDSLPDSKSRKFLLKKFRKNIVFILIKSSNIKHKKQIRARKEHFFDAEMVNNYIKNNWEKPKKFPHLIFENENKTKKEIQKELLEIYKRNSKQYYL